MVTRHSLLTRFALISTFLAFGLLGCSADDLDTPSTEDANETPVTEAPEALSLMAPAMSFNQTLLGEIPAIETVEGEAQPDSIRQSMACLEKATDAVFRLGDAFFLLQQTRPDDSAQVIGADLLASETALIEEIVHTLTVIPVAVFLADQVNCGEGELPGDDLPQMIEQIKQDIEGELAEETIAELSALFDQLLDLQTTGLTILADEPLNAQALAGAVAQLAQVISFVSTDETQEGNSFENAFQDGDERLPFFPDIFLVAGLTGQHAADQINQLGQSAQMDTLLAEQLSGWSQQVSTRLLPLDTFQAIYSDAESWPEGDTVLAAIEALRNQAQALTEADFLTGQQLNADSINQTLNEDLLGKIDALMAAIDNTSPAQPADCGSSLPLLGPILCLATDSVLELLAITDENLEALFGFLTTGT